MSKIKIETYRGYDIEFDTDYEKFQCIVTDLDAKESKSFSAVKKFIDAYLKDNAQFVPFYARQNPNGHRSGKGQFKVVGIRKDGRLIREDNDGSLVKMSDYDLSEFMLVNEANETHLSELESLDNKHDKYREDYISEKKEIIKRMQIVSLKDYKKTLDQ